MQLMSAHDRWQVFRGESTESCDLIFTAKRSSVFQLKTKLDVFLANNREDVCDFKVKGSWLDRSCVVYAGDADSSTIVARVRFVCNLQQIIFLYVKFRLVKLY